MSTRYVWSSHTPVIKSERNEVTKYSYTAPGANTNGSLAGYIGTGFKANEGLLDLYEPPSKPTIHVSDVRQVYYDTQTITPSLTGNKWAARAKSYQGTPAYVWVLTSYGVSDILIELFRYKDENNSVVDTSAPESFYVTRVTGYESDVSYSSFKGYVSSGNPSAYPRVEGGDIKGGLAYHYLGSDSIDPTALTYSKTTLTQGEAITVTVTPRSNTYGGTIYYQYQYSTNGGASWTNAGAKTTAVSMSITVPSNAAQFRARVLASDDIGFTSTDYVTGASLTVTPDNRAPSAPASVTVPAAVSSCAMSSSANAPVIIPVSSALAGIIGKTSNSAKTIASFLLKNRI